ncbi:MAG: nucleoside-diphosphate sugar epimerase, partial [Deltaproteobacteria bacterium]
ECIDIIEDIIGHKPHVKFEPDRHGDLRYFVCDIGKANRELHWEPKVLPRDGIQKLLDWITNNREKFVEERQ